MGCTHSNTAVVRAGSISENLVRHYFVENINDVYEIKEELGRGAYGYVVRGIDRKTGVQRALKCVELNNVEDRTQLRNEVDLLKKLQHPNIVRIHSSYEDRSKLYMVMDLCSGGEVFEAVHKQKKAFKEEAVAILMKSLLSAVMYLHNNQIVHRDIKLENLLFDSEGPEAILKICDFGFSAKFKKGQKFKKTLGTVDYLAPEVLEGNYTEACDLWAVGVICYEVLSGTSPFRGATNDETLCNILDGKYNFNGVRWRTVSGPAKSFIRALLKDSPKERISAKQALDHQWLKKFPNGSSSKTRSYFVHNMKSYCNSRRLKQMALLTVAFSSENAKAKLAMVQQAFNEIDKDQSGTISRDEFISTMIDEGFSADDASHLFDIIDQAGNGHIDFLEFHAATLDPIDIDEAALKAAFDLLDADSTGYISKENLKLLLGSQYEEGKAKQMIDSADAKKTGYIDFEEFVDMMKESRPSIGLAVDSVSLDVDEIKGNGHIVQVNG